MTHVIEEAKSGRSKCRGCNTNIAKGEWRFGEKLPNPFADDGDMTLWFHLKCGALRRPDSFEEVLSHEAVDKSLFQPMIELGKAHYRLERIAGLERAPSGRARCRECREAIAKEEWRIPLVFFEEGMFNSSGFVHVTCTASYFGTSDVMDRLAHFAPDTSKSDLEEVASLLA